MAERTRFSELVAGARDGDRDAVAVLWRTEQPRLLRVLRGEVGDAADDIASQTWLEIMGALRRFEGDERGFRALLFTIARRRVADHRRGQRRKPATPMAHDDLADLPSAVLPAGGSGADVVAQLTSDEAVRAIVGPLTPEQAEIVLLRAVAGFSADEVAAIVGSTPGAVRVQQHRALKRLAALMRDRADEEGRRR